MSHMVLESVVVATKTLSPLIPCLPIPRPLTLPCKLRPGFVRVSSYTPVNSISCLELGLQLQSNSELGPSSSATIFAGPQMCPVMKGKFGSSGAGNLDKGKLDMTQKESESSPEIETGGGGGDIGKNGGGDGGDDNGDDNYYFDGFDDDEGCEGETK